MNEIELPGLVGTNPLGFMAALGALDVADRTFDSPQLRWTETLLPHAVVSGVGSLDDLVEAILADRDRWRDSVVFTGYDGSNPSDIKPEPAEVLPWFEAALKSEHPEDLRLLHGLLSEGARAVTGKPAAKPTHLHFTAGQQKFLALAVTIRDGIGADELVEALIGPWKYKSKLGVLRWDNTVGEKQHALMWKKPSSIKTLGVPGADWLGLLGLSFFPTSTHSGELRTTACSDAWKIGGELKWPLWRRGAGAAEIRSLVATRPPGKRDQRARGIVAVATSEIRRTDQGGYGSFGPTRLS